MSEQGHGSSRSEVDHQPQAHGAGQAVNYLYLNLYAVNGEAQLYFNLSSDNNKKKHYVNILQHKDIIIKKVELNKQNWTEFNAEEGYIILPAVKKIKVKVTFGLK